tara:strand:- start:205 stop:693 length:489 start_codon:yes stop_codon:yes gene_type:complete
MNDNKQSLMEKYPDTAEKGITGEKWLYEKMEAFYDEVKDHTDDAVYQTNGIDFSVKQETWKRAYTLDVKNNLKVGPRGGKIMTIELDKEGRPGWLYSSQADRIYHVNTDHETGVFYDRKQMQERIDKSLKAGSVNSFKNNNDTLVSLYSSDENVRDLVRKVY